MAGSVTWKSAAIGRQRDHHQEEVEGVQRPAEKAGRHGQDRFAGIGGGRGNGGTVGHEAFLSGFEHGCMHHSHKPLRKCQGEFPGGSRSRAGRSVTRLPQNGLGGLGR